MPLLQTLKSRREFTRVRGGARASTAAFLMEMRVREAQAAPINGPRFGLTITKKLGKAVTRNRIRRRLKAAIAACAPNLAKPDSDYVILARPPAEDREFSLLVRDVEQALTRVHGMTERSRGRSQRQTSKSAESEKP